MRALSIRETDPQVYERLMLLAFELKYEFLEVAHEVARFVKRFFNKLTDVTEPEIVRIIGIIQVGPD
jgi:hypothetical protein